MSFFIIIQSTYSTTSLGLYEETFCKATAQLSDASTTLIPTIHELCQKNNTTLDALSAIGAYQGPGPFTTLRVILATLNGISYARNIPLVGIDGLDALLEENSHQAFPITIALLNAYNNDAYYGIEYEGKIIEKGYNNISQLLLNVGNRFPNNTIRFIGQGVTLFKKNILTTPNIIPYFQEPLPEFPTLDMIAQKTYEQWQSGKSCSQLLPLYLKSLHYKPSIT